MSRRRYNPSEHRALEHECILLATRVHALHETHQQYLARREELFAHPRYAKLPLSTIRECQAYLDGIIRWICVTEQCWAYSIDGKYVFRHEFTGDYSSIDNSRSRHVWKVSRTPW